MFAKKDKTKRGTRPSVYTTDTGGIGIDARELFTTDAGREAIARLVGIEFRESESQAACAASADAEASEDEPQAIPLQHLAR